MEITQELPGWKPYALLRFNVDISAYMFTWVRGVADVELSERCRFSKELVYTQDLIKRIYFHLVRKR